MKKSDWFMTIVAGISCFIIGNSVGIQIQKLKTQNRLYPKVAIVTKIDYAEDVLTVEDSVGHTWEFEGVEDYMVGDCVGMIMDNMGTDRILDDTIVKMHYCGNWVK